MTQLPYNNSPRSDANGATDSSRTDDDFVGTDAEFEEQDNAERTKAADSSHTRLEKPRRDEPAFGTSYLSEGKTEESWQQWRQIQANFVDDPRSSVAEAHGLVSQLITDIVHRFESEREQLEHRWSSGGDVNTEELRHCLQGYRDFFGRMLTNLGETKKA